LFALAVRDAGFQPRADLDRRYRRMGFRVDHGQRPAIAVYDIDVPGNRLIDDPVGARRGRDTLQRLERDQIEGDGNARLAVVGVTLAGLGRNGDAVRAARKGADLADDRALSFVDHGHMVAMRDVDAPGGRIEDDVVPAFTAAKGDGLRQAIGRGRSIRGGGRRDRAACEHRARAQKRAAKVQLHLPKPCATRSYDNTPGSGTKRSPAKPRDP
jgi:hypothetical protein